MCEWAPRCGSLPDVDGIFFSKAVYDRNEVCWRGLPAALGCCQLTTEAAL